MRSGRNHSAHIARDLATPLKHAYGAQSSLPYGHQSNQHSPPFRKSPRPSVTKPTKDTITKHQGLKETNPTSIDLNPEHTKHTLRRDKNRNSIGQTWTALTFNLLNIERNNTGHQLHQLHGLTMLEGNWYDICKNLYSHTNKPVLSHRLKLHK